MASVTLLKLLGGALGVGAVVSIPTAIIYSSKQTTRGLLKDGDISQESLKRHCYKILSDDVNRKDLSVCKNGESLKYYLISGAGDNRISKEIERVLSSGGHGFHGGSVIVQPKDGSRNESLSGMRGKDDVMNTLNVLGHGGLHNKCKNIDEQSTDSPKLNCGNGRLIPLTKY